MWTIATDLLILLARHNKTTRQYYNIHSIMFTLIWITAYFISRDKVLPHDMRSLLANDPHKSDDFSTWIRYHTQFATYIKWVVGLMFMGGIVLRQIVVSTSNILKPFRNKITVTTIRRFHLSMGMLIWAMTRYTVFWGAMCD